MRGRRKRHLLDLTFLDLFHAKTPATSSTEMFTTTHQSNHHLHLFPLLHAPPYPRMTNLYRHLRQVPPRLPDLQRHLVLKKRLDLSHQRMMISFHMIPLQHLHPRQPLVLHLDRQHMVMRRLEVADVDVDAEEMNDLNEARVSMFEHKIAVVTVEEDAVADVLAAAMGTSVTHHWVTRPHGSRAPFVPLHQQRWQSRASLARRILPPTHHRRLYTTRKTTRISRCSSNSNFIQNSKSTNIRTDNLLSNRTLTLFSPPIRSSAST